MQVEALHLILATNRLSEPRVSNFVGIIHGEHTHQQTGATPVKSGRAMINRQLMFVSSYKDLKMGEISANEGPHAVILNNRTDSW